MNFSKLFRRKSQLERLLWILGALVVIFFKSADAEHYTDDCRSIHGRLGTCVPLATCPLFYGWLKVRPLVKENLRLLVKYTCYFDTRNPKVCCPNDNLYASQEEEESPVGVRLATPVRRGVSDKGHSVNKLAFPEPSLSFPATSSAGEKSHHFHQEVLPTSSLQEQKREHIPLSFPTERYGHTSGATQYPQNEQRGGMSIWSGGDKTKKDALITRKDLRHHPNFRLIPKLHECSNARKLDSLIGTYGGYPWIALIGVKRSRSLDFEHVCAGAIINNRYILTASHCFGRANPRYVRLGEYDLDTLIDEGSEYLPQSKREDYRIEKLTIHPDYNPATGANDIALIRVEKPIALNTTFIKSVCLPFVTEYGIQGRLDTNSDMNGKAAWVAGWSRHSWDGKYSTGSESSVLKEGIVEFTSHERCRQDYPSVLSPFSSRTQFCVGGKGRRNSCVSDSGGPLMIPAKVPSRIEGFMEAKFFLLGLLSRGPTGQMCQTVNDAEEDEERSEVASRSLPTSVFTRVSKYLSWILDNMQE